MPVDYRMLFETIARRYGGADPRAVATILSPILIPIHSLDRTVLKLPGQSHYRATFTVRITDENQQFMQRGRSGKFVPESYVRGGPWREIAKGRIIDVNFSTGIANGEVYVGSGGTKSEFERVLEVLSPKDYLEVDQYGAAAKILSALVEYALAYTVSEQGYIVRRMPEDIARHLGSYYYYDFEFERNAVIKRVEVKSLWGTDTRYARLIHSLSPSRGYPTSSCKFSTQDIFAVSLFLRTGNIWDFAFSRSVPKDVRPYGLPRASRYPEHVNQNPLCTVGDGTWFATIDEVWLLS